jgi:hypothetical protein
MIDACFFYICLASRSRSGAGARQGARGRRRRHDSRAGTRHGRGGCGTAAAGVGVKHTPHSQHTQHADRKRARYRTLYRRVGCLSCVSASKVCIQCAWRHMGAAHFSSLFVCISSSLLFLCGLCCSLDSVRVVHFRIVNASVGDTRAHLFIFEYSTTSNNMRINSAYQAHKLESAALSESSRDAAATPVISTESQRSE